MNPYLPQILVASTLLGAVYVIVQRRGKRRVNRLLLLGLIAAIARGGYIYAHREDNGFDLSESLVPPELIEAGGPIKDGIPALDKPKFITAGDAGFLAADDAILGLDHNGIAKAYPIRILNWHEVVNDTFADAPILVTFCPLCGSGMAFSAVIDGKSHTFGVSGLLYNSDMLMYDRQTDSLWSQLMATAISGPLKGTRLRPLPLAHTTWQDWENRHPDTWVLSKETGFWRDYDIDPYAGYRLHGGIAFPVSAESDRYPPKEQVLGVEIDGRFKAYPFSELAKTTGAVTDDFAGRQLTLLFDSAHRSATVKDRHGIPHPAVISFWFAWYAFHPETDVFTATEGKARP